MKKLWILLMVAILALTAGCGGGAATEAEVSQSGGSVDANGHVTLDFWFALGGSSGDTVQALVDQFNASQSEITVNATYQGSYADTMAKLWNVLTSGGVPSVAQVGGAPLLGGTGKVVPITDYTDGENGIDRSLISQAFWDYNTADGKVWSMPFNQSVPVLYYNKDLFTAAGLDPETPPQTWDEMVTMAQALTKDTDGNGEIDQWGFNTIEDTHFYLSTLFLENGAQIVSEDLTQVLYNSPEAVEMLTMWGDWVNKDKIMPPNQHSEAKSDFLAGKLGMLMGSSSSMKGIEDEATFSLGVAMVPAVAGKDRVIPVGGGSLVIFANENKQIQDAAWTFVKFMTSKESSIYLTQNTGYLPIYTDALNWSELSEFLAQNPNRVPAIQSLQYGYAIPEFAALGSSDTKLRVVVQAIELGQGEPQQLLDDAKKTIDQSIIDQSPSQ